MQVIHCNKVTYSKKVHTYKRCLELATNALLHIDVHASINIVYRYDGRK